MVILFLKYLKSAFFLLVFKPVSYHSHIFFSWLGQFKLRLLQIHSILSYDFSVQKQNKISIYSVVYTKKKTISGIS